MNQNNILKQQHISKLENTYYENDIWDLTKHNLFNQLNEEHQSILSKAEWSLVNFSLCKNHYIKDELKYIGYHLIEENKSGLYSFARRKWFEIKRIIMFLNSKYQNIFSITDINYNILEKEFKKYLIQEGIKLTINANKSITSDMKEKQNIKKSPYLRFMEYYYNFYLALYKGEENIYNKDKWKIEDLLGKNEEYSSNSRTINFSNIPQEKIKVITKRYVKQKVHSSKITTILNHLKSIHSFSVFLKDRFPNIDSLAEVNREVIESYLQFLELQSYSKGTMNQKINDLSVFFDICILNKWDNAPIKNYIYKTDKVKKVKTMTSYIEDVVLEQLNAHLDFLPIETARMLVVLQSVGMRISELIKLKFNSVKNDFNNDYFLEYYQYKVDRINRVPINEEVAKTILAQEEDTKDKFNNPTYVFSQTENTHISTATFSRHINKLSFNKEIKDSVGKLFRFKSHMFRATVATKYVNMGISPNIIRNLLGHKSFQAINHYMEIFDSTLVGALESVTNKHNDMILKIGTGELEVSKIQEENQSEGLIPLPNGSCARPISEGLCCHANACLTCSSFKPNPKDLSLFEFQLLEAKKNLKTAEINQFERLKQVNKHLVDNLERIIKEIKGEK